MATSKEEAEIERKIYAEIEQDPEWIAYKEWKKTMLVQVDKISEEWTKVRKDDEAETKALNDLIARAREQFALIESQAKANDTEEPTHHSHQSFGKK